MSNVIKFPAVQDAADDVTLALITAADRVADVLSLSDLIRQPVVRAAIAQDASEAHDAIKAALLAAQEYHTHRADMARRVQALEKSQAMPHVTNVNQNGAVSKV